MDEGKNNQILSHVYRISTLLTEPTTTDRVLESIRTNRQERLKFQQMLCLPCQ